MDSHLHPGRNYREAVTRLAVTASAFRQKGRDSLLKARYVPRYPLRGFDTYIALAASRSSAT
jgi:hypothetical protein